MRMAYRNAAVAALAWAVMAQGSAAQPADGKQDFIDNCSACHQQTGVGIPGAYPALAGDRLVQGDPKLVASTVLHGRGGMPAFKDGLTDAELARILTYVRNAWGNKAGPMTPDDFAAARSGPPPPPGLQAH